MTRLRIVVFALVATLAVGSYAAPAPLPDPDPNTPEIIEIIAPAGIAQETLDSLNLGEPNGEQSERTKRTIGILRQLFPTLSQIVDQKIQQIISVLIRTVGRNLLAGAIGGNNSGNRPANDGGKISVSLPAFGADDDDDDSDEDASDTTTSKKPDVAGRFDSGDDDSSPSPSENEVQASNSTEDPNESVDNPTSDSTSSSSTDPESIDSTTLSTTLTTTTSSSTTTPSATSAVNADENLLSEAESQQSEVRVQFNENDNKSAEDKDDQAVDQESAASGGNNGAIDDLSLDDADASDENRNKRFLSFGGGGGDGHGGSGGGSGNFLFDIIRRPAESVARAAGQAFRILTGTDSIGLGITATHTAVRDLTSPNNNATKLVAGSGGTEASDEATASPDDVAKGDGYTEGIPGPVTRLFIIANRGISNLIQDLILRIAQTSERIVNFKARLITSII